jgi:hypothetical protein
VSLFVVWTLAGAAHHASLRAAARGNRAAFRAVAEAIEAAAAVETKTSKQQKTKKSGAAAGGVIGGPVVVEVGSRDGLLALFAARVGAARVLVGRVVCSFE